MAASTSLYATLHHLLVTHPVITTFQWTPHQTTGATPLFLFTILLLYLTTTFLLHHRLLPFPRPSRSLLRLLSPLHNLLLLLLSLTMALGCTLSSLSQMPSPRWLFCFPTPTPPSGPVFFWAQVFYMSKIYEFVDTLLVIVGNKRLTFLHVYHHAVVVVMCYVWIATAQSLVPVALVTNAAVHVLMYGYYLSSSLGWRWSVRWKRVVTDCQIVQFGFSFVVSLVFLWLHFFGGGCSGMNGWVFNAVFNVSLFALFIDFHRKNYAKGSSGKRKMVTGEEKES